MVALCRRIAKPSGIYAGGVGVSMKKTLLALTIILSPLFISNVLGCTCPTIGGTSEQLKAVRLNDFNKAVAVFSGEVMELDENKVKFKVEKIWKGELVDEIEMIIRFKDIDGNYVRTSCDYHYKFGEKFLVYAYEKDDELTTYQCSRTTPFKNSKNVEQEIKGLNEIKLPDVRNAKSDTINN